MDHAPASRTAALRTERLAILALLVGAVVTAFAPILVRVSELGPTPTAFYRFLLAVPLYWALALTVRGRDRGVHDEKHAGPRVYLRMAMAGAFLAGDMSVWHYSILMTTVANASLLLNVTPVFVVLGGWFLFRTRVTGTFMLGLAAAMAGVVVLSGASLALSRTHFVGDVLGVVTAMFYAAYQLTIERLRRRFSTITIMLYAVPACAMVTLPVALLSGDTLAVMTPAGWAVLVALAAGPQVLGQGLIAWALAHLPASFVSVSLLVQPIVAGTVAWFLFNERIGAQQAIGAIVVVTGIVIARRGTVRR
ncbi:MAG: DMT family transporter [Deltaproteobacteria bacterium]|nr:DMT family transporter [Deltaproteobacteria bacterium]